MSDRNSLKPGERIYAAGPEGVGPCRDLLLYREPFRPCSVEQKKKQYERRVKHLLRHRTVFRGKPALLFRHFRGKRVYYIVNGELPDWKAFYKNPDVIRSRVFGSISPGCYTALTFSESGYMKCTCVYGEEPKARQVHRMERVMEM